MEFNEAIKQSKRWDDFFTAWLFEHEGYSKSFYNQFLRLPFAAQSGVFLEYLREQGIFIENETGIGIDRNIGSHWFKIFTLKTKKVDNWKINNPDYQTGLKEAILRSFNL